MNQPSIAFDANCEETSQNELNVKEITRKLSQEIRKLGYPCEPYSNAALKKFRLAPVDQQQNILRQLNGILVLVVETPEPTPEDLKIHPEKHLLNQALRFYGLEVPSNFWTQVKHDDIIEIYSKDEIQIFRTLNFFNITGYSLLDLLTNEWFHLWERPSFVMERMYQLAESTLTGQPGVVVPMEIPTHILKEIYHPEDQPNFGLRSCMVDFGYIGPVTKSGLPVIAGMIVSSRGKLLGTGEAVENLAVI